MKLLFICTHNRCRSILAEAAANHLSETRGNKRIEARSAGSQPAGEVHPLTIKYLVAAGINTNGLKSQSWDDFEDWQPDVVVTVCDSAAREQCPVWLGQAIKIHWGLQDPSKMAVENVDDSEVAKAFKRTLAVLEARLSKLFELEFENFSESELIETFTQLETINGPV